MPFKNVGFIGLGAMGLPMAINLVNKLPRDVTLHIYDVQEEPLDSMKRDHADRVVVHDSAKAVASHSDIIVSMVPEGSHVKAVYLDADSGVCQSDISNKILIDCSTIDTATNLLVKEHITKNFPSASFYDAPVSGGVVGAEKGTLAIFLGCAEDDPNLSVITDLLSMVGKTIIPCGGPSLGLSAKLSNNYLSGIIAIACSEALDMGMRAGIDPRTLAKVYAAGTAQNTICDKFCPCPGIYPDAPSSRRYKGGFKVQLMRKDFALALEMAERVGARNVLGGRGLEVYEGASADESCRDLDSRVVYRYLGGNEDWEQNLRGPDQDS